MDSRHLQHVCGEIVADIEATQTECGTFAPLNRRTPRRRDGPPNQHELPATLCNARWLTAKSIRQLARAEAEFT
jgi:hypothetical protein